jgi:hypothetical protein
MQEAMEQSMMPMTLAVGLLMLRVVVLLLKKCRSGLQWSNRYAWASLVSKAVNSVLAFVYTMPAMKEMMASGDGNSPPSPR